MVTAVDVETFRRDDLGDTVAVPSDDRVEELLRGAHVGQLRPLAIVDGVEASGDALPARIFLHEPIPKWCELSRCLGSFEYALDATADVRVVLLLLQLLFFVVLRIGAVLDCV